jgi:hypothetical protein
MISRLFGRRNPRTAAKNPRAVGPPKLDEPASSSCFPSIGAGTVTANALPQYEERNMAKGISIHIGLNSVDPDPYEGWDGALVACEKDARDMEAIARAKGYTTTMLLTPQATSKNVKAAIESAASKLAKGDILFLTYSGHGGQMRDTNGDEKDKKDETWVLYDRQLIDDELFGLWSKFAAGVRICVLSDSCHSGTVIRNVTGSMLSSLPETLKRDYGVLAKPRFRMLPDEVADADFQKRSAMYTKIQAENPKVLQEDVKAHVLLISGCQDNQTSEDGAENGRFTGALRSVYKDGKFTGNYSKFYQKIRSNMPPWQTPNFAWTGARSAAFEREQPFTI